MYVYVNSSLSSLDSVFLLVSRPYLLKEHAVKEYLRVFGHLVALDWNRAHGEGRGQHSSFSPGVEIDRLVTALTLRVSCSRVFGHLVTLDWNRAQGEGRGQHSSFSPGAGMDRAFLCTASKASTQVWIAPKQPLRVPDHDNTESPNCTMT
ncbi:hypothetical protein L1987_53032 [Smallanthus sonchifolius]|uniref:Uncharacterized protein n=1 Tax=Smallanthus sonchifolius TaxID=185202 RepID=A0ACB9EVY4_9ASTR|nr:hypothetical protein L1987_53032 [Smallanthus sonchifolius]